MDDILWEISRDRIQTKMTEINGLHPALKFTIDMKIIREERKLSSTWYTKPTDTGSTVVHGLIFTGQ